MCLYQRFAAEMSRIVTSLISNNIVTFGLFLINMCILGTFCISILLQSSCMT